MDAVSIASQVCNYRHLKLATVKVGGDRENPLLVREGVTSKQVMAELVARIEAAGLLPTKLKNGGGVINITPQRMESRSGWPSPQNRLETVLQKRDQFACCESLLVCRVHSS